MRRVWVVAPELLMIDGLDLLTGLSTLAYLHSTTRFVRSDIAEKPGRIPSQDWSGHRWWGIPLLTRVQSPDAEDSGASFEERRRRSCTTARIQIRAADDT